MRPSDQQTRTSVSARLSDWRIVAALAAIIVVAALLTIHRLGEADVCGVNEAVEGVFVQQMVEHGALIFPLENGHNPMYKPPLFHWTATALDRAAGVRKVTAFNLRLPAALYAIAGVALTMAFALEFLGASGAILAGLILCGSYQYIEQGRIGRVDMTLCFFEALALFSFMWWFVRQRFTPKPDRPPSSIDASPPSPASSDDSAFHGEVFRWMFAIALGLGVLAKGPVGALLPAAACGIFLMVERRWTELRRIASPGPVLVTILIGGSWYAACFFGRRYGFLDRQLGSENFGRFFGSLGEMAPWYYVKPLLLNSAPFSLFVPVAVWFALRTWRDPLLRRAADDAGEGDLPRIDDALSTGPATLAVRLFAIFWIVTVVFFTIAAYKRRAYLLPLWPPSAIMLAWWIESLARNRRDALIARSAVGLLCGGLIVFNFIYLPMKALRGCHSYRTAAAEINRIVGPGEPLYSYRIGAEPAPLLFYLDRNAPPLRGRLGDAPPGYVLIPANVWESEKDQALELQPVFESSSGPERLILLRYGKAYARTEGRWQRLSQMQGPK